MEELYTDSRSMELSSINEIGQEIVTSVLYDAVTYVYFYHNNSGKRSSEITGGNMKRNVKIAKCVKFEDSFITNENKSDEEKICDSNECQLQLRKVRNLDDELIKPVDTDDLQDKEELLEIITLPPTHFQQELRSNYVIDPLDLEKALLEIVDEQLAIDLLLQNAEVVKEEDMLVEIDIWDSDHSSPDSEPRILLTEAVVHQITNDNNSLEIKEDQREPSEVFITERPFNTSTGQSGPKVAGHKADKIFDSASKNECSNLENDFRLGTQPHQRLDFYFKGTPEKDAENNWEDPRYLEPDRKPSIERWAFQKAWDIQQEIYNSVKELQKSKITVGDGKKNDIKIVDDKYSNKNSLRNIPKGKVQSIVAQFENKSFLRRGRGSIFYIEEEEEKIDGTSSINTKASAEITKIVVQDSSDDSAYDDSIDEGDRCSQCFGKENVSVALSILSFAGTLGNLLRLPRMVYFHGGGVFLLVYVLVTLVFGIPLTFLEIGLGQFCQHGTIKLWRAVILFRGVGFAKVLMSLALAVSYSTQIASGLSLLVYTANEPHPYSDCELMPTATENGTLTMMTSLNLDNCLLKTVLASSADQPTWFGVKFLFLLLVWTIVFICVMKRSVTYRRAMYFIFPALFALMAALLVESSTHSTNNALNKLFTINWLSLGDIQVWYFAIVQMFFSLQVGFGNISTCAGRIYPKSNAFWSAICLVISSLIMGIASVILVYLWLDNLGPDVNIPPNPETFVLTVIYQIATTDSTTWTYLAYILVLISGLASLIALTYTALVAAIVETKRKWRWRYINGAICAVLCIISAVSIIPGELKVSHVLEHYLVSRGVVAMTVLELIGFAGVYGCSNLYNDLEFVIGSKLSSVWKSLWLITPAVLIVVEVCSICLLPLDREYGQNKDSEWVFGVGWALYFTCWLLVFIFAVHQIYLQVDYNMTQKLLSALKPSRNWGPVDPIYRHCWVQWRNRYHITGARDFTLKRRGTKDFTHHVRTATPAKTDYNTDSLQWQRH